MANNRVLRGDLGWAAFILALAALFGVLYHYPLVSTSLRGGLADYLEGERAVYRETRFQGINTASLAQVFALHQAGSALFIDARPAEDYRELHIAGAVNLAPGDLAARGEAAVAGLDKDRRIVVYCSEITCDAALKVAEKLQALGFTKVEAFLGGFTAWDEAGYPVDTEK